MHRPSNRRHHLPHQRPRSKRAIQDSSQEIFGLYARRCPTSLKTAARMGRQLRASTTIDIRRDLQRHPQLRSSLFRVLVFHDTDSHIPGSSKLATFTDLYNIYWSCEICITWSCMSVLTTALVVQLDTPRIWYLPQFRHFRCLGPLLTTILTRYSGFPR